MVRGLEGNEMSTPRPSSAKQTSQSQAKVNSAQKSILGFFQRKSESPALPKAAPLQPLTGKKADKLEIRQRRTNTSKNDFSGITPAPSSDGLDPLSSPVRSHDALPSSIGSIVEQEKGKNKENGLPSPVTPGGSAADVVSKEVQGVVDSLSPARKVRRKLRIL